MRHYQDVKRCSVLKISVVSDFCNKRKINKFRIAKPHISTSNGIFCRVWILPSHFHIKCLHLVLINNYIWMMVVELWWYCVDIVLFPRVAMLVSIVCLLLLIFRMFFLLLFHSGSSIRGVLVCHHTLQKPLLILTLMSTLTASFWSKKMRIRKFVLQNI